MKRRLVVVARVRVARAALVAQCSWSRSTRPMATAPMAKQMKTPNFMQIDSGLWRNVCAASVAAT